MDQYQKSFACPWDGCHSSYPRKDHLNRHTLRHQGKSFQCTIEECKRRFTIKSNMTRHVKEFHNESSRANNVKQPEEGYVCAELGCGKVFKYPSKLRKHKDSHIKLRLSGGIMCRTGCMKFFSNEQCLKEHIRSCHRYIICDKCGMKQLKKYIKRHMRKSLLREN